MKKKIIFILMSLCVCVGLFAQAQFDFKSELKKANAGDAVAQYNVGDYIRTHGKNWRERRKAYGWFHRSAEQGYVEAYYCLGKYYGIGPHPDLKKAAEMDHSGAQYELGIRYKEKGDYDEAIKWLIKAATLGYENGLAQYELGKIYKEMSDYNEAIKWFTEAAECGHPEANGALQSVRKYVNHEKDSAIASNTQAAPQNGTVTSQTSEVKQMGTKVDTIKSDVDMNIPKTSLTNDKTFAVVIANEKYSREMDVPYAINDGRRFKEYCTSALGVPENNVHLVENATLNDLRHEVNWVTNVMDAYSGDAKVIFYYAGHGIPDESSKSALLLPVDGYGSDVTTGYSLSDLYSTLGGVPSKSVIVFLDACFSGTKREGDMMASARGVAIKVNETSPVGNMVVFSASQGDGTAYPYTEQGHGLFTYYLLKKLQDTKGDVTLGDLSDYVIEQVKRQSVVINSKPQTPTLIPSPNMSSYWRSEPLK